MDPIGKVFAPLLGLPAWNSQTGDGWYVTVEFGEPSLEIGEVRESPLHLEGAPNLRLRRPIWLNGQWGLAISSDDFALLLDDVQIAGSSSSRVQLDAALHRVLNGQALTSVHFDPITSSTNFTFDLGGTFRTLPNSTPTTEPEEQWTLSEPSGDWFVVNDAGQYSHHAGSTKPDEVVWHPLTRQP